MYRIASLVFFILLLQSCSSLQISQDYIAEYSYSSLNSFAWKPNEDNGYGIQEDDFLDKKIRTAIESTLSSRSYKLIDTFNPDFFISYYVTVKSESGNEVYADTQHRYGNVANGEPASEFAEGTLLIDVTIPLGDKLVWRGIGTQLISKNLNTDKKARLINQTVEKILAQFPPRDSITF